MASSENFHTIQLNDLPRIPSCESDKISRLYINLSMEDLHEEDPDHLFEKCEEQNIFLRFDSFKDCKIFLSIVEGEINKLLCYRGSNLILEYGWAPSPYLDSREEKDLEVWDSTIAPRYDLPTSDDMVDIDIIKD